MTHFRGYMRTIDEEALAKARAAVKDELSVEAFNRLAEELGRVNWIHTPARDATRFLELGGSAIAHCQRTTDEELWKLDDRKHWMEPSPAPIDPRDHFQTYYITKAEHDRLLVHERAYKLAIHVAKYSLNGLDTMLRHYYQALGPIADAQGMKDRPATRPSGGARRVTP